MYAPSTMQTLTNVCFCSTALNAVQPNLARSLSVILTLTNGTTNAPADYIDIVVVSHSL